MFRRLPALSLCLVLSGCLGGKTITWEAPVPGVLIVMELDPTWAMQRDWTRTLTLVTPQGSSGLELFEDSGWWRGSNLYITGQGTWLLDEGQGGCVSIALDPPKVAETTCPERAAGGGGASLMYQYYSFLGYFSEGSSEEEPRFINPAERAEEILPDDL